MKMKHEDPLCALVSELQMAHGPQLALRVSLIMDELVADCLPPSSAGGCCWNLQRGSLPTA